MSAIPPPSNLPLPSKQLSKPFENRSMHTSALFLLCTVPDSAHFANLPANVSRFLAPILLGSRDHVGILRVSVDKTREGSESCSTELSLGQKLKG